jgi:uncharacterized protein YqgC (DUF456 family)
VNIVGEALLVIGMTFGIVSIPFGLPGALLVFLCALIYAITTHFSGPFGWPLLTVLGILTLTAETADNWLSALGAKRYGASTKAIWLSFLGGLLGAVFLGAPLTFIAGPLGPIVGGFAGAFAIVAAYEYKQRKNLREALRAGFGTFLGRMAGMVLKAVIAVAMFIAVIFAIL